MGNFNIRKKSANAKLKLLLYGVKDNPKLFSEFESSFKEEHYAYDNGNWGVSLGASLLYYLTAFCPKENLPQRLKIINPFSCRKKLAAQRGFELSGQWIFSPEEISAEIKTLEAVVSMNDTSIPIQHGIHLLNLAKSATKNLIFVEANHQISDYQTQLELAELLIKLHSGDIDFDSYNSCNVYKQWGKISSHAN